VKLLRSKEKEKMLKSKKLSAPVNSTFNASTTMFVLSMILAGVSFFFDWVIIIAYVFIFISYATLYKGVTTKGY